MSPAVSEILETNNTFVRKWGTMVLAVMDYSTPLPDVEEFFGEDHLPMPLPSEARDLGFITTDGVTMPDSLSAENSNMLQTLEPVRTDLTGRERSLTVAFGEVNAWVNALWHGLPVSEWPAEKYGPWSFSDTGEFVDYPWLRLLLYGQDGVGDQAVYRVEAMYRAKVTAKTDRTMNRSAEETFGFTFGLFRDPVSNMIHHRAQDSPSYHLDGTEGVAGTGGQIEDVVEVDGGDDGEGSGLYTTPGNF